ncbi:MAG: hypothetical protein Q9227_008766 [Pyrenula ochraceoflavens]
MDLKRKTLAKVQGESTQEAIYLCGNSLGLQPGRTRERVDSFLSAWATKNVLGHFTGHEDSTLPPWLHVDDEAARLMAPIVGALPQEIAVMGTLTANLHLLMASFYKPTKERYKIILEGKAFPSDHYAVESQITSHGLQVSDAMVLLNPDPLKQTISTDRILSTISEHATNTALIILPGVQFYTGQYLEIEKITKHAHALGIPIGWDCAHAAGNVDLKLHDWNVDFAAWCNYKYLNSGPGAIAAIFVHERHGQVNMEAKNAEQRYRPRWTGWWGADKSSRFDMENTESDFGSAEFVPRPGAAGYQLSNPSALDLASVTASLEVFHLTNMDQLRRKSLALTGFLELLLQNLPGETGNLFEIITPQSPGQRGAQLSLKLKSGLLDAVLEYLSDNGVVVDERKPDVIRVAPAPLYNSYMDVFQFVKIFQGGLEMAQRSQYET